MAVARRPIGSSADLENATFDKSGLDALIGQFSGGGGGAGQTPSPGAFPDASGAEGNSQTPRERVPAQPTSIPQPPSVMERGEGMAPLAPLALPSAAAGGGATATPSRPPEPSPVAMTGSPSVDLTTTPGAGPSPMAMMAGGAGPATARAPLSRTPSILGERQAGLLGRGGGLFGGGLGAPGAPQSPQGIFSRLLQMLTQQ